MTRQNAWQIVTRCALRAGGGAAGGLAHDRVPRRPQPAPRPRRPTACAAT
jgi:hypothetical protein